MSMKKIIPFILFGMITVLCILIMKAEVFAEKTAIEVDYPECEQAEYTMIREYSYIRGEMDIVFLPEESHIVVYSTKGSAYDMMGNICGDYCSNNQSAGNSGGGIHAGALVLPSQICFGKACCQIDGNHQKTKYIICDKRSRHEY